MIRRTSREGEERMLDPFLPFGGSPPGRAVAAHYFACASAQAMASSATSSQPSWLTIRCVRPLYSL